MTTKVVSPEDLIKAAEKNGFRHARGAWFRTRKGERSSYNNMDSETNPIISACFLGQVAINLGVDINGLRSVLNDYYGGLGRDVISWNDSSNAPYATILKRFQERITAVKNVDSLVMYEEIYHAKRKDSA